jgi:large subunit ribosomal protein L23
MWFVTLQIEIKRVLESLYGLEVEKVHTLNMEGKKKLNRKTGTFYRRPDYKKAYVVLKNPISLPKDVFPLNAFEEASKDDKKSQSEGVKSAK